ncbi:MAG: PD40 domain-containing protein [Planctomycetales bacterium]|nr:PD40 domain-containing protein [Planctomycetales bacterium]
MPGYTPSAIPMLCSAACLAVASAIAAGEPNQAAGHAPQLRVTPTSIKEPDEGETLMAFELHLAEGARGPVTFSYKSQDYTAAAGADYEAVAGEVTLSPDNPQAQIEVRIFGDTAVEGSEVLLLDWRADSADQTDAAQTFGVILTNDLGPHGGKIAFDYQAPHERYQSIYVMNADGSRLTRLTSPAYADRVPVFSNDGSRIVFESRRDGNPEIYVMDADGSNQRRITNHPAVDGYARFSPDGRQIVFFSNRAGDYNVYLADPDGSGEPKRLTQSNADDFDPCFSVDGRTVFFPSTRDGDLEIYAIGVDGENLRQLTDNEANEHYPSASPDGASITFRTNRDGQYEVYTMGVDGSQPRRVTHTPESERHPAYSPDGKQILFQQFIDYGLTALCAVDSGGGGVRVLRGATAANLNGSWAPGEVTTPGPSFELGLLETVSTYNRRFLAKRMAFGLCGALSVSLCLAYTRTRLACRNGDHG